MHKNCAISLQGHLIDSDSKQFIISHPALCNERGSALDKGKTFVGYWVVDEQIELCGLKLNRQQRTQIEAIKREHEETKCGFSKRRNK